MSQQHSSDVNAAEHAHYYVPAQSKWPIIATLGLLITVFGVGTWFNDLKANHAESNGPLIFFVGALFLAYMLFGWFGNVIKESRGGFYSPQMDRSFRWGMSWFIFSEVMFFAAFFGVLFYVRTWAGPWLGGEGAKGVAHMLWPSFEYTWPLLNSPDPKLYPAPSGVISPWGLPLLNTILLVSSSFTLTFAHHALRKNQRKPLTLWMALTVLLGIAFLVFQVEEYIHAYGELGLTLGSGIYGATFFMLTGFHGAHVTLGALMLSIMLIRIIRGHFSPEQHFGFEAAAWYWHFVDVVWIGLFVFVYVL
jgi:cytochrome c oxidase subunit 3